MGAKKQKKHENKPAVQVKNHSSEPRASHNSCGGCNTCYQMTGIHSITATPTWSGSGSVNQKPCGTNFFQRNLGNSHIQNTVAERYTSGWGSHQGTVPTIQRKCACGGSHTNCDDKEEIEGIQAKMIVGQANDIYEQEADRVANQIMRMSGSSVRKNYRPLIDANTSNGKAQISKSDIEIDQSGGRSLSMSTREFMEPRFGVDFNNVYLHTDQNSYKMASKIQARAFTYKNHIWLGKGESEGDGVLMAHELTHAAQQNGSANLIGIQRFTTSDCSTLHDSEIRAAYIAAQNAIPSVVTQILNPTTNITNTLQTYFGTSAKNASIGLRLNLIRNGLNEATAECENPGSLMYNHFCDSALAYVRPAPAFFGFGNIHLCQPGFHNLNNKQQMATLIHEGAHRYIGASDKAYYLDCLETNETKALSDLDRWDNADSYGCLVQILG